MRRGGSGTPRRIRGPNNPGLLQEGIGPSVGEAVPDRHSRTAKSRCSIRRPSKFTLVDTCFPTHHVQFGFDANRTLWASSGGIGAEVLGWVNTKMLEETGDEAKSQGWTRVHPRHQRQRQARRSYVEPNQPVDPTKDKRIRVGFYAVAPSPVDGTIWGTVTGYPGLRRAGRSGRESARDGACGNLRGAAAGVLAARRGHRQPRRHVGRARERTSRRLRPPQVQGSAQRPGRDRQALPRGLDALSAARDRSSAASPKTAAAKRPITPGSTSTTRSGSARTCRSPPATRTTR